MMLAFAVAAVEVEKLRRNSAVDGAAPGLAEIRCGQQAERIYFDTDDYVLEKVINKYQIFKSTNFTFNMLSVILQYKFRNGIFSTEYIHGDL